MQSTFPTIFVRKDNDNFSAVAGIKLLSILKGDLLFPDVDREERKRFDPFDQKAQHRSRELLLGALSSWPASITLELHITSLPDLLHRASGELLISLFFYVTAPTETDAKEQLLTRYLSLMPLLASYIPEAEFSPITDKSDLSMRINPMKQTHAVSIERREEVLQLAAPLTKTTVGFGKIENLAHKEKHLITHRFPWVPSYDDWSRLLNTFTGQLDPVQVILRIRTADDKTSEYMRHLENTVAVCEDFIAREKESQVTLAHQAKLIRDITLKSLYSLMHNCFNVGVFLLAQHAIDESLGFTLGQALTAQINQKEEAGIFQGGFCINNIKVQDALAPFYFAEKAPFSITEAACVFRLPSPPVYEIYGLSVKLSRTSLIQLNKKQDKDNIFYFLNKHRGIEQEVFSEVNDRMLHTFIIGQTGTGKSTLMESMIIQDIKAGRGVGVIDPHGELVESILGKIPRKRADDVIYFNTLDRVRPLGFNILQWETIEERDLIIDELYLALDRIYDMKLTGGPMFEANLRGSLKLLMGDKKRDGFIATLLEFIACYQRNDFRHWLSRDITDSTILDFLKELDEVSGEASIKNMSPYITSKFSRFVNDRTLQRIIGQEYTTFDFDEIVNSGKIFLINLGKGRFGSIVSALLTNHIVSRFKLAAMKRGDIRPEERKDFMLYVDECHNLPQENFMELLSEVRKYRMGLILSSQYTKQCSSPHSNGNSLLDAILGNVGTIIVFRLGKMDATELAPILYPQFGPQDIVGLPNWQGYAKMQHTNLSAQPFSFVTIKDKTTYDASRANFITSMSRLKYGKEATEVDKEIAKRRNVWKEKEVAEE